MFDGAEFGRQMAAEVKNIIAPLYKKIEYLEAKILELQEPLQGPQGERGERGLEGPPGKNGTEGPPGRDGRDGLPGQIGERGKDGMDGKDGKDGVNGKDGTDGLGFKDLVYDGERTLTWKRDGDEIVMKLPIPIDRGVYRSELKYERGDTVSCDGSAWFAQRDTTEKPGQGSKDWRLAVKRGRDGKDGKGEKGDKGDPGRNGRDLTQMDFDGRKFG